MKAYESDTRIRVKLDTRNKLKILARHEEISMRKYIDIYVQSQYKKLEKTIGNLSN